MLYITVLWSNSSTWLSRELIACLNHLMGFSAEIYTTAKLAQVPNQSVQKETLPVETVVVNIIHSIMQTITAYPETLERAEPTKSTGQTKLKARNPLRAIFRPMMHDTKAA